MLASKKTPSRHDDTLPLVTVRPPIPAWLLVVLLALVTLALYCPALRCDFVTFDDPSCVAANPHVQGGLHWAAVKWAFTDTKQHGYWAPVLWLSHMLACQFFGLNPWGHHLINILLHAANTTLVFLLFRHLTGGTWRCCLLAMLFAVHPLRVESVAWVTERKDVLSTCFGLLSLMCYARYAELQRLKSPVQSWKPQFRLVPTFYLLSLCLLALGLMSKPMLVTWPFVLLLLDYWPLRRFNDFSLPQCGHLLAEKIPFFALAILLSLITFLAQQHGGAVIAVSSLPLSARVGNALISYCRYLGMTFWPAHLAFFYPHPGYWPLSKVLLAAGLLLGISAILFRRRHRQPYLLVGWLWFVGTLVPVIGLTQSGEQALADRFTYVPVIGLLMAIIWGAHDSIIRHRRFPVLTTSVAAAAGLILCLGLTRRQIGYWQDSETLYRHALAVTENNHLAHNNLGIVLRDKGQIDEAICEFQAAIRLKPGNALFHRNLGFALAKKDETSAAINEYQQAIQLEPDNTDAHNNLGTALTKIGLTDEAIREFQTALRLNPNTIAAHVNLGVALAKKGLPDAAIDQYHAALRLEADNSEAHYNLGQAYFLKNQFDAAIVQFQAALHCKPADPEIQYNLGAALALNGQLDPAIQHFQAALRLKPDYAQVRYNLALALAAKGQTDPAIEQYRQTLRLKPDYAEARNNLGTALARKGQLDEAIQQLQEAVRLRPDFVQAQNNLRQVMAMKNTPPDH